VRRGGGSSNGLGGIRPRLGCSKTTRSTREPRNGSAVRTAPARIVHRGLMLSTSATLPERDPGENYILDALPGDERTRLFSHMTLIEMPVGMVLYECSDELRYIYSPIDSIVSLVYFLENGASAEIAVVGNDGVIGMALFMGGRCNHTESCGRPERGLRLPARGRATQRRVHRHGDLLQVLLLYTPITNYADGSESNLQSSSLA
jgi:hypothetical protein